MTTHKGWSRKSKRIGSTGDNVEDLREGVAKVCGFGCGTRVYKDKELKLWMEEWSNTVHDKRRCWAVKEKQKRDATGEKKAPRIELVEELRVTLSKLTYGIPLHEQVYHLIKGRKDKDDAVTMKELAMALHPDKIYVSKAGLKEPTPEALTSAGDALSRARKWKLNDNAVIFAVRFVNGQYMYYNMQIKEDFKPTKKRLLRQVDGIQNTIVEAEIKIRQGQVKRQVKEQALDAFLDDRAKRKKNGKVAAGVA